MFSNVYVGTCTSSPISFFNTHGTKSFFRNRLSETKQFSNRARTYPKKVNNDRRKESPISPRKRNEIREKKIAYRKVATNKNTTAASGEI